MTPAESRYRPVTPWDHSALATCYPWPSGHRPALGATRSKRGSASMGWTERGADGPKATCPKKVTGRSPRGCGPAANRPRKEVLPTNLLRAWAPTLNLSAAISVGARDGGIRSVDPMPHQVSKSTESQEECRVERDLRTALAGRACTSLLPTTGRDGGQQ